MRTICGEQGDCDLTDIQGMPAWGVVHVSYYNWTASKNVSNLFKLRIGRKQLSCGMMTNRVALWSGVGGAVKFGRFQSFDSTLTGVTEASLAVTVTGSIESISGLWPSHYFANSQRTKSMCHVDSTSLGNKLYSTSCSEVSVDSPHFLPVCRKSNGMTCTPRD